MKIVQDQEGRSAQPGRKRVCKCQKAVLQIGFRVVEEAQGWLPEFLARRTWDGFQAPALVESRVETGEEQARVAFVARGGEPENRFFALLDEGQDRGGLAIAGACGQDRQRMVERQLEHMAHALARQDVGTLGRRGELTQDDLTAIGHFNNFIISPQPDSFL